MRPYKIAAAPPFDGKPVWHGLYYRDGHWHEVRNQQGNVIAYASAAAAMEQARASAQDWAPDS